MEQLVGHAAHVELRAARAGDHETRAGTNLREEWRRSGTTERRLRERREEKLERAGGRGPCGRSGCEHTQRQRKAMRAGCKANHECETTRLVWMSRQSRWKHEKRNSPYMHGEPGLP
eukprot:425046-Pleurochrysis_carterae.AAC.2